MTDDEISEIADEVYRKFAQDRQPDYVKRARIAFARKIEAALQRRAWPTIGENEVRKIFHHSSELAKFADRAALVLATLEAENSDEEEQIQQIIDGISTWAPPVLLGELTANAELRGGEAVPLD